MPAAVGRSRWTYTRTGYAIGQSLAQLKQHRFASLITALVLGITLSLPVILYFSSSTLASLSQRSAQGESLTIYLDLSVDDLQGAELAQNWAQRPNISHSDYISRDQALAMLNEDTDVRDAIEILGANPLPGAVVLYPQQTSSQDVEIIANEFRTLPQVSRVQMDLRWVRRLEAAVTLVKLISGLLAAFLSLTALVVIGNTIRLEMARRRNEMEVARLLGASASFINRPVLCTGAVFGFLGGIIACTIALIVLHTIKAPTDELSALYQSEFRLTLPVASQILLVIVVATFMGLAGAATTLIRPAQQLTHKG